MSEAKYKDWSGLENMVKAETVLPLACYMPCILVICLAMLPSAAATYSAEAETHFTSTHLPSIGRLNVSLEFKQLGFICTVVT